MELFSGDYFLNFFMRYLHVLVGIAWIGLDRPGYGIHGTPEPERVGRTESHGCFRLANWNADLLRRCFIHRHNLHDRGRDGLLLDHEVDPISRRIRRAPPR